MSIEAKKQALMRILGSGILFLSAILITLFDIVALGCLSVTVIILATIIPWMVFFILLKLEKEMVVEFFLYFLVFLLIYTSGLVVIGQYTCISYAFTLNFVFIEVSYILIGFTWHYSLSLYKTKKIIFLICGVAYCIVTIIFRTTMFLEAFEWLGILPLLLTIVGMLLIIIAETMMRKKGFLNYI